MNKVYISEYSKIPLTPKEIAGQANAIYRKPIFVAADFEGPGCRIDGAGHGYCNNECEFVLLPASHPDVAEGGKRYMICRKCGAVSHL